MTITKVLIVNYHEESEKQYVYELDANLFNFILRNRMTWGDLFAYLNAVSKQYNFELEIKEPFEYERPKRPERIQRRKREQ